MNIQKGKEKQKLQHSKLNTSAQITSLQGHLNYLHIKRQ